MDIATQAARPTRHPRHTARGRKGLLASLCLAAVPGAIGGLLLGLQIRWAPPPFPAWEHPGPYLMGLGFFALTFLFGYIAVWGLDLRVTGANEGHAPFVGMRKMARAPMPSAPTKFALPPTDEARAEAMRGLIDEVSAAQSSLEQLRRATDILESLDDGVCSLDHDLRIRFVNPAALDIIQMRSSSVLEKHILEAFPALKGGITMGHIEEVARTGRSIRFDIESAVFKRPLLIGISPLPEGLVIHIRDMSAQRAAEEKLRTAEERLRVALDGGGMATWDLDIATGRMRWSPRLFSLLNLPETADGIGFFEDWHGLVAPRDSSTVKESWLSAHRNGGVFRNIHRIHRRDGETKWLEAYGAMSGDHRSGRFLGVVVDVTTRQQGEEQRTLLSREIDHRAKNVLATIQAIVRMTPRNDPAKYAALVEGRVGALARAHSLLSKEGWAPVSLRDVVWGEMASFGGDSSLDLSGPVIRLDPIAVQPLAVVLHELGVNAATHGALSRQGGTVVVRWSMSYDGGLTLLWQERGGPLVSSPPSRKGFGRKVIDSTIINQLGGSIRHEFRAEGLVCSMTLPREKFEAAWEGGAMLAPVGETANLTISAPVPSTKKLEAATVLDGARILVVEDEHMVGSALVGLLSQWGCDVVGPAATFESAVQAVADVEKPFDLALVDVNLNGKVSYPVAEILASRGTPVFYLTGYGDLPETRLDIAAGMLCKPVSPDDLKTAISRVLAVRKPRRAAAA